MLTPVTRRNGLRSEADRGERLNMSGVPFKDRFRRAFRGTMSLTLMCALLAAAPETAGAEEETPSRSAEPTRIDGSADAPLKAQTDVGEDIVDPETGNLIRTDLDWAAHTGDASEEAPGADVRRAPTPPVNNEAAPPYEGAEGFVDGESVAVDEATTPTRIVYENPDGTFTHISTPEPVRAVDEETGEWTQIDLRLEDDGGDLVSARNSLVDVVFDLVPAGGTEVARVELDGETITFAVGQAVGDGARVAKAGDGADGALVPEAPGLSDEEADAILSTDDTAVHAGDEVVEYAPTDGSYTSVELSPTATGLKTTYEVADRSGADGDILERITLPTDWSAAQVGDGIELRDAEGEIAGRWLSGVMWDAGGRDLLDMGSVDVELVSVDDDVVTARIDPDASWLDAPDREWPVFIDPELLFGSAVPAIDLTIHQGNPTVTNAGAVYAGDLGGDETRALVYWYWPTMDLAGIEIADATFGLMHAVSGNPFVQSCAASATVEVRQITESWTSAVTWGTRPSSTGLGNSQSLIARSEVLSGCPDQARIVWDVTSAVQDWVDNNTNWGFEVRNQTAGDNALRGFVAAEFGNVFLSPALTVNAYGYRADFSNLQADPDPGYDQFHRMPWPDAPNPALEQVFLEVTAQNTGVFDWPQDDMCVGALIRDADTGTVAAHYREDDGCNSGLTTPTNVFNDRLDLNFTSWFLPSEYDLVIDLWNTLPTPDTSFVLNYGLPERDIVEIRASEPPTPVAAAGQAIPNQDFTLIADNPYEGSGYEWQPDEFRFIVIDETQNECTSDSSNNLWQGTSTSNSIAFPKEEFADLTAFAWCVEGRDTSLHNDYEWTWPSEITWVQVFQPEFLGANGYANFGGVVDSVNLGIGNYVETWVDIDIPAVGPQLGVARTLNTYNTADTGAFGPSFAFNYDMRAEDIDPAGLAVTIVHPDGRHEVFTRASMSDPFDSGPGYRGELTTNQGAILYTTPDGTVSSFLFNRLETIVDPHGHTLQFNYDSVDIWKIDTVVDARSGRMIDFTWSGDRITVASVDDPADGGSETLDWTYHYTTGSNPKLEKVCDPRSTVQDPVCWEYHWSGGVIDWIEDARGNTHADLGYDGATGQVDSVTRADNGTTTFGWTQDPNTHDITATATAPGNTPAGLVTAQVYNPDFQIISDTVPGQTAPMTYQYNGDGLRTHVIDALGNTSRLWYDSEGQLTRSRNAENESTYYRYDTDGNRTHVCDGRSADENDDTYCEVTVYGGTTGRQLLSITRPAPVGLSETRAYTNGTEAAVDGGTIPPGLLRTLTDGEGRSIRYSYDSGGDLRNVTERSDTAQDGLVTNFTYDSLGRLTTSEQVWDTGSATTATAYDDVGNVVTVVHPLVHNAVTGAVNLQIEAFQYDENSNPTLHRVAQFYGEIRDTWFEYDAMNREETTIAPDLGETSRTFDAARNVASVTDAMGQVLRTTYGATNRAELVVAEDVVLDPRAPYVTRDIVRAQTSYDALGRPEVVTDVNGSQQATVYDKADRVGLVYIDDFEDPDGGTRDVRIREVTEFDGAGNPKRVLEGGEVGGAHEVETLYEYDAAGRMTRETVVIPNGDDLISEFQYDDVDEIEVVTIKRGGETATTTNVFDGFGRVAEERVGNGALPDLVTTFEWDDRGLMIETVPPRGNESNATPADHATTHTYDALGQLTHVRSPDADVVVLGSELTAQPEVVYGYDPFGGRTEVRDARGFVTTTDYDEMGRIDLITHPPYSTPGPTIVTFNPTEDFDYDLNGNLISRVSRRGETTTYEFDSLNRPVRQVDPAIGSDPPGIWESHFNDDNTVAASIDPTGAVTSSEYDMRQRAIAVTEHVRPKANFFGPTPYRRRVGMVVGDAGALTTNDTAVKLHLEANDYVVTSLDDDDAVPADPNLDYDVYLLAESSDSSKLTGWTDVPAPVVVAEPEAWDELGLASSVGTGTTNQHVAEVGHDIAAGLSGTVDLTASGAVKSADVEDLAPGAELIVAGHSGPPVREAVVFSFEAGTARLEGVAPSRRVAFGGLPSSSASASSDGMSVLVASMIWAVGGVPELGTFGEFTVAPRSSNTTRYEYNDLGSITAVVDPIGNRTETGYNAAQEVTWSDDALAQRSTFEYTVRGAVSRSEDRGGRYTTSEYDVAGRLTDVRRYSSDDQLVGHSRYSYDADSNVVSEQTPNAGVVDYVYDELGRLREVSQQGTLHVANPAADQATLVVRDPNALLPTDIAIRDALVNAGFTVTIHDDNASAASNDVIVISQTAYVGPLGSKYDGVPDPVVSMQSNHWDDMGLTGSAGTGSGVEIEITDVSHPAAGALGETLTIVSSSSVRGVPVADLGSGASVLGESFGKATIFLYEDGAIQFDASPAAGRRVGFAASQTGFENLTSAGEALIGALAVWAADTGYSQASGELFSFEYDYDASGNLTRVDDGNGSEWLYSYNSMGLLQSTEEPASAAHPDLVDRVFQYAYDAGGLPTGENVAGGGWILSEFDELGRVTRTYGASDEITYSYDLLGRPLAISDTANTSTQAFSYDDRGLSVSSIGDSGISLAAYDANSRLLWDFHDGAYRVYTYTARNEPDLEATWSGPSVGAITDHEWALSGELESIDHQGAGVRTYTYDTAGRLDTDTWVSSQGTLYSADYGYDDMGNITSEVIFANGNAGDGTWTYGYDEANRLINTDHNGVETVTVWDKNGNRLANGSDRFTYDERNRLVSSPAGIHEWDPRGTLDQIVGVDGVDTTFDDLGRMADFTPDGEATINYGYDGLHRLIDRNGTAMSYLGGQIDPVNDGSSVYRRGAGGGVTGIEANGTYSIAIRDRHGDMVGTVDHTTGQLNSTTSYDSFGEPIEVIGDAPSLGYQSDYTDPDTGDVWMGARWYTPSSASFRSRDTVFGELRTTISLNRYTYGNGNPMSYFDPDGRSAAALAVERALAKLGPDYVQTKLDWYAVTKLVEAIGAYFTSDLGTPDPGYRKSLSHSTKKTTRASESSNEGLQDTQAVVAAADVCAQSDFECWVDVGAIDDPGAFAHSVVAAAHPLFDYGRDNNNDADGNISREDFLAIMNNTHGVASDAMMWAAEYLLDTGEWEVYKNEQSLWDRVKGWAGDALEFVVDVVEIGVQFMPFYDCYDAIKNGINLANAAGCGMDILGTGFVADAAKLAGRGMDAVDNVGDAVTATNRAENATDASRASDVARGGCNSFSGDTHVLLADGSTKPIEDIAPGDVVFASDPESGEEGARAVTHTWPHEDTLLELQFADGSHVVTTEDHHVWNETDREWQETQDLDPGDAMRTPEGHLVTVDGLDWASVHVAPAYDLTVDDIHTYFVVTSAGDEVLVHNCDGVGELANPTTVNNASSPITSFVTETDSTFVRVYSDSPAGSFLADVAPASADDAVRGLALPPSNTADFIQDVTVPAGTRIQSSVAAEAFGQPGGLMQFELLERIPDSSFGPGRPLR